MENQKRSWLRGNCIGQGSFGTVSLAVDKSDAHLFVVKSVELTSSQNFQLEALENEIKILKSLSSPHVITYLGDDFSKESSTASYRNLHLEYMSGGTAAELPGADVDEKIIKSVTSCVVSALRYVHSLGIVHCDVKARNILVGSSGGGGAPAKLADFGSAGEWKTTVNMRPRGSPLWMAPEVVRGEYQGPESDVWSLGCTVIEMVTGKPAWEDRGGDTLCRIGYWNELPDFPAQLSEVGRDFLGKCLRRDYKERWSCDQLLRHPFLLSSCPVADCSPRCTLDWLNSSFAEEDDEEGDKKVGDSESSIFDAKQRIMQLGRKSGAIWEEWDGWVTVRTLRNEKEDGSCSNGSNVEERERLPLAVGEISGRVNWKYSNSNENIIIVVNQNYFTNNVIAGTVAGWSCSSELEYKITATVTKVIIQLIVIFINLIIYCVFLLLLLLDYILYILPVFTNSSLQDNKLKNELKYSTSERPTFFRL